MPRIEMEMRTVTLEPDVLTPLNKTSGSSSSKSSSILNQNQQFNNFDFDQQLDQNIYNTTNKSPSSSSSLSTTTTLSNEWKVVKSKSSLQSKNDNIVDCGSLSSQISQQQQQPMAVNECGQPIATDPVKRLRNLKKKLKEIETLILKNPSELEKEQLQKIQRHEEIVEQIEQVTKLIEQL